MSSPRPSPVGVIMGVGGDISDADDAFLAMVGYTRQEFVSGGMNWREMTPPEFLHRDEAGIRQAMAAESGGFTMPYQKEFVRKGGSRVPVLLVCAFIPGTELKWMGYVVDLSTPLRGVAEHADATTPLTEPLPESFYARLVTELVRERARMVAMLDNTDALIWAVDPEARLVAANEAFQAGQRQMSGRDLAIGETVLGPAFPTAVVELWRGLYARAAGGERFSARTSTPETPPRYFEQVLSPIVDSRRGVTGVAVVSQDVTARKVMEDAVRESEASFRAIATSSPVGIFRTDVSGRCVYANPRLSEIWELSVDEMAGVGYRARIHPDDIARAEQAWIATDGSGRGSDVEFRLLLPSGERLVRSHTAPIRDGDAVIGYVGTVEDETQRQRLAQRERQREKMESLGTLAGGIAHDFNNMLGVILGFAEIALSDLSAGGLEENIREIKTAGERARELVRQILTFSRRSDSTLQPVDLALLIREGVRLLRATLPATVVVGLTMPNTAVVVRGDASALQQIILNLCTNAAYSMREKGGGTVDVRLEVSAASTGEGAGDAPRSAVLWVSDEGEGMSDEVKARAFEPFFTTKPIGEGTGMGLAVVHGVVQAHGGQISLESTLSKGTTFRVELPLVSGPAKSPDHKADAATRSAGRVLVAEDESALADVITKVLERAGYGVTCVANGMEALRLFLADPDCVDVVVTDLTMPGLSGDKLAQAMRLVRPHLPIVLTTGFAGALDPDRALHVSRILPKPFGASELTAAVEQSLATAPTAARSPPLS